MISEDVFREEYIRAIKEQKEFARINPANLEKMIYAFFLLELLKHEKLDFVFKGGTCLALLFDKPKRFSIDVDILTSQSREEIEKVLSRITDDKKFVRFVLDEKRSYQVDSIPKAHYYFSFNSVIDKRETGIMLDVLFGENFYPKTKETEINNSFLKIEGEVSKIITPTINSLTGDKLTTFAPNTTGYQYKKELELQIVKQLFDLSFLFDEINDYEEVFNAFEAKVKTLNTYPNNNWKSETILDDIFNSSLILSTSGALLQSDEMYKYEEFETGVSRISDFLIQRPFHIQTAIEAASKVALLSAKIKMQNANLLEPFNETEGLAKYIIEDQRYSLLNKLRKQATLSLYYWNLAIKTIGAMN